MSTNSLLFLTMRVFHVVLAGAWFGAAVLTTLYLGPAVKQAGPAGSQIMDILVKRGFEKYMASIGGLTIVTGGYLFWHFMVGFGPGAGASHAGMAFSVGATTGIIALILGGSMIGASAKKLVVLGAKAAGMPEGADRAALLRTMEGLRVRMATFGKIVVALLFISMGAMALGHYI
jgi:hypothetical protein